MDLTTETHKVKGLAKSRAEAAVSWQESGERERKRERWLGLGPFLVQGWCLKQTENLNKDGSHQLERRFLFNILEDHGKKVTLLSWSLVANIITDGICPGWVFLMAHDQCFHICHSCGCRADVCLSIVCALCHVLHLSAELHCPLPPVSRNNTKYVSGRVDSKQQIIIITPHVRARRTQDAVSDGYRMDRLFPLQIPSSPTFAHCGFVFLFRLSESKMSVAFI